MNKFQKTAAATLAGGALLLQTVMPVLALDLTVTGNGAESENEVEVEQKDMTVVEQVNETKVSNKITATANTGGNDIEGTTGGSAAIFTGSATTAVQLFNTLNSNAAEVENCNCGEDVMVDISKNGAKTENEVELESKDFTGLFQENEADIDNEVEAASKTGKNYIGGTTQGSAGILTGSAGVGVLIDNQANSNVGSITGSSSARSLVDLMIRKNGYKSDNEVKVELERTKVLDQVNETNIDNDADADAGTGKNGIEGTTGGEVVVDTGEALAAVEIYNLAGSNEGHVDCDCLVMDVSAEIAKNGSETENEIKAELEAEVKVEQENTCGDSRHMRFSKLFSRHNKSDECFDNAVEVSAKTGLNWVGGSTDEGGDPSIWTGYADVFAKIQNFGGVNTYNVAD